MKRFNRSWMIKARSELGMTQEELAQKCGCDPSYIWHIESGTKVPNVHLGLRIAHELGKSPYAWLEEERIA